jgi:hypothetical protein
MMAMTIFMGIDPRLCPSLQGAGLGNLRYARARENICVARQRMDANQVACQFAASALSAGKQMAFNRCARLA